MQPADSEQKKGDGKDQKVPSAAPTPASPPVTTAGPSVPTTGPVPPPPDTTRTKELADEIVAKFPSTKVDYVREKRLKVTVPPEKIKAVALFVRDVLGFDHLNVVGGTDYIQQKEIEVIYFVGSISSRGSRTSSSSSPSASRGTSRLRSRRSPRSGRPPSTTRGRPSRCSG